MWKRRASRGQVEMTWNGARSERASHAAYDGKTKEANNFGQFRGSRARPAKQREREREEERERERVRERRARVTERMNDRPKHRSTTQRDATHRARGATCNAARPPPPTTVRLSIGEHPGDSHPDSPFARLFALFSPLVRLPTCRHDRARDYAAGLLQL